MISLSQGAVTSLIEALACIRGVRRGGVGTPPARGARAGCRPLSVLVAMTSTRLHGPTADSVLEALTQERLLDLSRAFGIGVRSGPDAKGRVAGRLREQLSGGSRRSCPLNQSLTGLDRCVSAANVPKHLMFTFQPTTPSAASTDPLLIRHLATRSASRPCPLRAGPSRIVRPRRTAWMPSPL